MNLRSVLDDYKRDLALVIGNGINRYGDSAAVNSWDQLLLVLASKYSVHSNGGIPDGIALTEFYDLLKLEKSLSPLSRSSLQSEFCDGMDKWRVYAHHRRIVQWAQEHSAPILTTNFDTVLARAGECCLLPGKVTTSFTDFYPWCRYYGNEEIECPLQGFGVWHINGMQKYHRSIRLGLTDYMGSVERVRGWIHKSSEESLFSSKESLYWKGANTWLHIIFNKNLLIFGLGLEENEVFLRWLLIERAMYFNKFPGRRREGWYCYTSDSEKEGKLFFLNRLGLKPLRVASYDELYGCASWQ